MRQSGRKTKHAGIKDLGAGQYAIRITYTCPKTGKRKDVARTINAQSLGDALAEKVRLSEELQGGRKPKERRKLSDVSLAWLERKCSQLRPDGSTRLAPASIHVYRYAVESLIVPTLGSIYVDALSKADVEVWRDTLAETLASTSVNSALRTLKTILRDVELTVADRVGALTVDDTRITESEPNLLTEDELQRFIGAAREVAPGYVALILTMFTTGARVGTATALRWEDIDFERGTITFRRRLSRGEVIPGVKRSRTAIDVTPLLPELARELELHRARLSEVQRASGLVFPTSSGAHVERGQVNRIWARVRKAAGISKRLTPHAARRTAATLLRRAAGSVVSKAVCGHTSDRMHEHYSRVDVPEMQAAARTAFRVISGGAESPTAQDEAVENVGLAVVP